MAPGKEEDKIYEYWDKKRVKKDVKVLESAKLIASGIATIGLAGAGVGNMPLNHGMLRKKIELARKT